MSNINVAVYFSLQQKGANRRRPVSHSFERVRDFYNRLRFEKTQKDPLELLDSPSLALSTRCENRAQSSLLSRIGPIKEIHPKGSVLSIIYHG